MPTATLKIRNWDRWQSYRADRGQPPWIKIHRTLMRNVDWVALNDAQRGQLVAIWLLAADHDGVIPASPVILQKLCFMDAPPDLKLFMEHGFIEPDANVTSIRRQHDAPETETETETEREGAREKPRTSRSPNGSRLSPDWVLPDEWRDWAAEHGMRNGAVYAEAEKFRDYWTAKAGKDARKTDWLATWRNWVRRSTENGQQSRGHRGVVV